MSEDAHDQIPAEFLEKLQANKKKRRIKMAAGGGAAVTALAVAVVLLLFAGAGSEQSSASTGTYTSQVTEGDLNLTVEGGGTLSAGSTTSVSSQVDGTVKKVYVSEGDKVKKGATLYTLESEELQDAVVSAKRQLKSTRAAYKAAKAEAASAANAKNVDASAGSGSGSGASSSTGTSKTGESSKTGKGASSSEGSSAGSSLVPAGRTTASTAAYALTQASVSGASASTTASSSVTAAKQAYDDALDAYEDAIDDLAKLKVTAPASGTVAVISVAKGDVVQGGTATSSASGASGTGTSSAQMVISDMSEMSLSIQVSEYDIDNIKKGQSATVEVGALDKTVSAIVKSVSKTASSNSAGSGSGVSSSSTAYYDVTLFIPKPSSKMLEGMNATATVTYRTYKDALLVPTAAISTDPSGNSTVMVQGAQGTQRQVAVTVLGGNDETSAVESDALTEESEVVVTYRISDSESAELSVQQGDSRRGEGSGMGAGRMMGGADRTDGGPGGGASGVAPGGNPGGN